MCPPFPRQSQHRHLETGLWLTIFSPPERSISVATHTHTESAILYDVVGVKRYCALLCLMLHFSSLQDRDDGFKTDTKSAFVTPKLKATTLGAFALLPWLADSGYKFQFIFTETFFVTFPSFGSSIVETALFVISRISNATGKVR